MKSPLLLVLLLCLCVPGQCDCQADCLACTHILPRELHFNTLVCVVECEDAMAPAYTWDLCRRASAQPQFPSLSLGGAMLKRAQEQAEAVLPGEEDQGEGGLLYAPALQRYDHVSRALDQLGLDSRTNELSVAAAYNSQNPPRSQEEVEDGEEEEEEEEGEGVTERGQEVAGRSLSKRFGGFLKGKNGYRKLMAPARSFQKRYGGFIGVRKSARKWNNQKRFSEFLKQYLGMSARSSEYNSVSEGVAQQNQV